MVKPSFELRKDTFLALEAREMDLVQAERMPLLAALTAVERNMAGIFADAVCDELKMIERQMNVVERELFDLLTRQLAC